jgi:ArsR family transcriptional regulator, virulence genes transcriptional regulator
MVRSRTAAGRTLTHNSRVPTRSPPTDAEAMRAHAGDAARLLKALANDHRLLILCMLVEGEHSVSEMNERLDLSQSALSQHLARLREEGLVETRREAQTIYYRVAKGPVQRLIQTLHGIYCSVR